MHCFAMIKDGSKRRPQHNRWKGGAKTLHSGRHGGSHTISHEKGGRYATRKDSDRSALESTLRSVLNRQVDMVHDRGSYGGDRSETMEVLSCDVVQSCSPRSPESSLARLPSGAPPAPRRPRPMPWPPTRSSAPGSSTVTPPTRPRCRRPTSSPQTAG